MSAKCWEFFLTCHLDTLNVQRRTHWRKLHKGEKALQAILSAQLYTWCPKDAFVDGPHPPRLLELLVVRERLVDDDALGSMCKALIDVLKCRWKKLYGKRVLVGHGILWDDSRKFVRITFDQKTMADVGIGAVEGVKVMLTEPEVEE